MGIQLTAEEMRQVKDGKLDPSKIEEHRKQNPVVPVKPIDNDEVDKVKQEIRETNLLYKQAIDRNKSLYNELAENRKHKEKLRNKIAELRKRKKVLLGTDVSA